MTWRRTAAVATGGAIGASLRWAVLVLTSPAGSFPWPVLLVNVLGSLAVGVLSIRRGNEDDPGLAFEFGAIGFCGGLTTFSTFTVEVAHLAVRGGADVGAAVAYSVVSVVGTVACVMVGREIGRSRPKSIAP